MRNANDAVNHQHHPSTRSLHWPSVLLGAALVLVGYHLRSLSLDRTDGSAFAQEYQPVGSSFFKSGNPAIITSSADGKTLHFWGLNNRSETIDRRFAPRYVGEISSE